MHHVRALDFDGHEAFGVLELEFVDLAEGGGGDGSGVVVEVDENVFDASAGSRSNMLVAILSLFLCLEALQGLVFLSIWFYICGCRLQMNHNSRFS